MSSSQKKTFSSNGGNNRDSRKAIAEGTLAAVKRGSYTFQGTSQDLTAKLEYTAKNTKYYSPTSLAAWTTAPETPRTSCDINILEISTLEGTRRLVSSATTSSKVGVLNFASAKKPGGGFLTGAQAQEESIARSSTIYPSLTNAVGNQFYSLHKADPKGGYYSHAMIYSPDIVFFKDDAGKFCSPITADVLTSCAVNAGVVRGKGGNIESDRVDAVMKERMARVLFLLEQSGATELVLGSFGTGVFKNNVSSVARIWAELLAVEGARFRGRFRKIIFAIIGTPTFNEFTAVFEATAAVSSSNGVT